MAAGAGGVDLAILVVAADEGVMPQTREHLDICQLLGVRAGVVALTKADLLPDLGDDWRALLDADLATLLAGSVLESAEVVPVSARTGEGLDALRAALGRAAAGVQRRPADGPLFLPVDRAFTIKGFGTVVTGTLLSGMVEPEASVSLLPGLPGPFRVRGVQTHGQTVPRGSAGQRTAVNLPNVATQDVQRGMVLVRTGELPETRSLDVELTLLPAAESPLTRRRTLLLHLGTRLRSPAHPARSAGAGPGETGLAQLRLQAPVAGSPVNALSFACARPCAGRGAMASALGCSPSARHGGGAARPSCSRRCVGRTWTRDWSGSRDSPGTGA
jgi:selenocysteine-specific elongation factor